MFCGSSLFDIIAPAKFHVENSPSMEIIPKRVKSEENLGGDSRSRAPLSCILVSWCYFLSFEAWYSTVRSTPY